MDLSGKTIGNYQITNELGRGGMAVVYRAYQASLNRYVAIKVLPPQLSFDEQFVQRFQREARAAAGLRHPNIVVIHDVGHEGGIYYLVMEYLEGRTLREVIQQEGPLKADGAAHIAEQLAAALDYAHRQGFVHRDVKPANIFVGEDDRVTLTDFGIAKAASETQQLTRTGMLVGTPEYMSPEQAEGGIVDHRTDLYALGVVLYQMLVGRVPFSGTTPHATLHAVIYEAPPPPREINPGIPSEVETTILKAIAKQPEQRFQRGGELTMALKSALEGKPVAGLTDTVTVPAPPSAEPRQRRRSPVVWIVGAIAIVVLMLIGAVFLLSGDTDEKATPIAVITQVVTQETSTIETTEASVEPSATAEPPARTPDIPTEAPTTSIGTDTPLPAIDTAEVPTDVPPSDTPQPPTDTPRPPTDTPVPLLPSARFGRVAFSSNRDGNPEIYVVNLADGEPIRLTNNNANDWLPDWSPDGSGIAFTSHRTGSYDLWVMRGDGSGQTPWVSTGAWDEYARWAPDSERLSLSTTATTEGVDNSEIFVRQRDGSLQRITYSRAEDQWADWSPDGRIIFAEGFKDQSNWDLHVMNADGSNRSVWLGGPACDVQPAWSPNGQWIAFLRISRDTNGNGRIDYEDAGDVWVGQASGGDLRQLTSGLWATTPTWSPDSQWIAFAQLRDSNGNGQSDGKDAADIQAISLRGGELVPLIQSPHRDGDPTWTW